MKILLLTPPLTQLNTPYPATPYLKSFLKQKGHEVLQADLGIELVNRLFTREGLTEVFKNAQIHRKTDISIKQMLGNQLRYLDTVEAVMRFLQDKEPTLATRICNTDWLPRSRRFDNMADVDWAFGTMGNTEMAKYIATLYIEDLSDFINSTVNPKFELIRYAESLCLHLPEFDPLLEALEESQNLTDVFLLELLQEKIEAFAPDMVCFSIPFPGNLMGALVCSKHLRQHYPQITLVWGGGYVSTELRQLSDARIFDFTDYICLDQGAPALLGVLSQTEKSDTSRLHQTFFRDEEGKVQFVSGKKEQQIPFKALPAPDYSDLPLDAYISLIETANPMHKLWSDGRWNKLTLAGGCYWAKCAFCDTSLPYISCFEPLTAGQICDYMESIMAQTGCSGFHFTDEAAPPKLLRALSDEILQRKMVVSWWTNIRFEKNFDAELCGLLAAAGCIAVSGGVEVASNRLLELMNKGVSVEQAFETASYLAENGIMVHAYLMYGFPTQTFKETLKGLDVVRRMFQQGVLQSAFWHRYAMTVHSPSGIKPEDYGAERLEHAPGSFANNEIPFTDRQDMDLDALGEVLRRATFNYMHGIGLDWPVKKWL